MPRNESLAPQSDAERQLVESLEAGQVRPEFAVEAGNQILATRASVTQVVEDEETAYENKKRTYEPSIDKIAANLTGRMSELFQIHNVYQKADPAEYEACIEYAIEHGKSTPENALFYLISGMADGLLATDRGVALASKHLNVYPALVWFDSQEPKLTQAGYRSICEKDFGAEYKAGSITGNNSAFKSFYWTQVVNEPMVAERVKKTAGYRIWDHDWARTIAPAGDSKTAKRFLEGRSGKAGMASITAVENALAGSLQWMEENAKHPNEAWRAGFNRQIGWMAMADGIGGNLAYSDIKIYSRYGDLDLNRTPREGGQTNHSDFTVHGHLLKMRGFMDAIDPKLFKMLRDDTITTVGKPGPLQRFLMLTPKQEADRKESHLRKIREYLYKHYKNMGSTLEKLHTLDDVFENIDEIVSEVTEHLSDAKYMKIIQLRLVPSEIAGQH